MMVVLLQSLRISVSYRYVCIEGLHKIREYKKHDQPNY